MFVDTFGRLQLAYREFFPAIRLAAKQLTEPKKNIQPLLLLALLNLPTGEKYISQSAVAH